MASFLAASLVLVSQLGAMPAEKEFVNSIGVKFVRIEPGAFRMGQEGPAADYRMTKHPDKFDDADWDERPVHRVTISASFYLGTTEITLGNIAGLSRITARGRARTTKRLRRQAGTTP